MSQMHAPALRESGKQTTRSRTSAPALLFASVSSHFSDLTLLHSSRAALATFAISGCACTHRVGECMRNRTCGPVAGLGDRKDCEL